MRPHEGDGPKVAGWLGWLAWLAWQLGNLATWLSERVLCNLAGRREGVWEEGMEEGGSERSKILEKEPLV